MACNAWGLACKEVLSACDNRCDMSVQLLLSARKLAETQHVVTSCAGDSR